VVSKVSRQSGDPGAHEALPACPRPAFTLIELLVVISVIVLVLAIAMPGLSAMNRDMRLTAAQQSINGALTTAYYHALADRSLTAVRFFPGAWDAPDPESNAPSATGRQHMAIYSYVGSTVKEEPAGSGNFKVAFGEYFERTRDTSSVALPEEIWVAPLEAISRQAVELNPNAQYDDFGPEFVLDGKLGEFRYNVDRGESSHGRDFLNADDFLIVCDPQTGVQTSVPRAYRMNAYSPSERIEVSEDPGGNGTAAWYFKRYSFSGVVTYRREALVALGATARGIDRYDLLQEDGRPFLVHRFSGALLPGLQRPD
jgi:prepilin-type N-terminal cleavage/methylation domain-containing protein